MNKKPFIVLIGSRKYYFTLENTAFRFYNDAKTDRFNKMLLKYNDKKENYEILKIEYTKKK